MILISIRLDKMLFPGKHGLHAEEILTGNMFEVAAEVRFEPDGKVESIGQTVNYADLFELVRKRMLQPAALLETLAQEIISDLYLSDKRIRYIQVWITKKNPPIEGFSGEIGVSAEQHFPA